MLPTGQKYLTHIQQEVKKKKSNVFDVMITDVSPVVVVAIVVVMATGEIYINQIIGEKLINNWLCQ